MSPIARRKKSAGRKRGMSPLVWAAIMIAIPLFITYYAFNKGLPFVSHYTDYALVNNSVNVRTGSPVRIAGIDVGEVQGVSPAGDATKISFTMNSNGLPIHQDATIRIRDRLFLEGGYYLDLNPGSPSAPVVGEGWTIPESQTSTPVQFYNVLSTFDVAARASLKNLLETLNQGFSPQPGQPLSDSGAGGFKSAIPQLTPVMKDTAQITRALRGTQNGDVETLLSSGSDVTTTLAQSSAQLADLVTGFNRVSTALASSDGALAQSIQGLDQTLQVAPAALTAVDHSLPPLANLAGPLTTALKASPPLLTSLTADTNQLTSLILPSTRGPLLSALKTTLSDFPALLTQLAHAFPITKQVTDCLRTHVVPLLQQQVPDGSLSTNEPVWKDFVHFLPNVAGASGNFDANGPYVRVLAGVGNNGGPLINLPIIGPIGSGTTPGGSPLGGASPTWIGTLTPSVFHPEVPCAKQALPSLATPAAAADFTNAAKVAAPSSSTVASVRRLLSRVASRVGSSGGTTP